MNFLLEKGLTPDTHIYNNLLGGCAHSANHILAERILDYMTLQSVERDQRTYTAVIKAFSKAGYWKRAVKFLDYMKEKDNVEPDTICYSAAISACASKGRVKEAIDLLTQMKERNIPTDSIIYNSMIDAAAQAGNSNIALSIVNYMFKTDISRDVYTYTSAISACDKADGNYQSILKLIHNSQYIVSSPNITCRSRDSSCSFE